MTEAQQLSVRLYQWALADSLREMEAGFPAISKIPSVHSQSFLWSYEKLAPKYRPNLVRALVRRFHLMAIELLGEPLLEEELRVLQVFDEKRILWPSFGRRGRGVKSATMKRLILEWFDKDIRGRKQFSPKSYVLESLVDKWSIKTEVSFERFPFYRHLLLKVGEDRSFDSTSIQAWMGICSMTTWDLVNPGDEEIVCSQMRELILRFEVDAPGILNNSSIVQRAE